MEIKKENIGEILQRIYDSEIHLRIGWLWDGGVDFLEGTKTMSVWEGLDDYIVRSTHETDMVKVFARICNHLILVYPKSDFTRWFKKKFNLIIMKCNKCGCEAEECDENSDMSNEDFAVYKDCKCGGTFMFT